MSPESEAAYRDLVARGVTEFDAGRFAEARALFVKAHELWPNARTLRVLGMTSFELRSYAQAQRELRAAFAAQRRPLSESQRGEITALLDQTAAYLGRYRVQLTPATASLFVDGNPAVFEADGTLELEVGSHELIGRADGYGDRRVLVLVQGREDKSLMLDLTANAVASAPATPEPAANTTATPAPASVARTEEARGLPLWPFLLGGAVVTGGVALATFLIAEGKADCRDNTEPIPGTSKIGCSNAEKEEIQSLDVVTVSAAIASGALLTASVVLWLSDSKGADNAGARVHVGPGYVLLRGRY